MCAALAFLSFALAHVLPGNSEGEVFMTYIAAHHKETIKMFLPHFLGAVMLSQVRFHLYSSYSQQKLSHDIQRVE